MKTPRMAFAAVLCSALALPALAQSSMPMPSGVIFRRRLHQLTGRNARCAVGS
ncbi:MAG: hypothetical protein ACT6S0_20645 [Roseateles sp.]|uniref:hypothetical protein n=1 Tax=Roseateles sp. TaxID=1971397 RepID=UPI0040362584